MPAANLPVFHPATETYYDEFEGNELNHIWYRLRTPKDVCYTLTGGKLRLKLKPEVADSLVSPSMLIRRIQSFDYSAQTHLFFNPKKNGEEAGMIVYRSAKGFYTLLKGKNSIHLVRHRDNKSEELAKIEYKKTDVYMRVECKDMKISFYIGDNEYALSPLLSESEPVDILCDNNRTQKFSGTGIGIYATSNGQNTNAYATFYYFKYENVKAI